MSDCTQCVTGCVFSGSPVNVSVTLEREDEVTGPVIAPFFPQVRYHCIQSTVSLFNVGEIPSCFTCKSC